jgi:hypothetical protein
MQCGKCGNRFPDECVCPDLEKRLEGIAPFVAMWWCSGCGKHQAVCKCSDPKPSRVAGVKRPA